MKNTYTNEYYQKVRKLLPEINFKEGRFLRDIKKLLTDYEKTHPKCTYEDLVKEFESPDEVVYNYIAVEGKTYLFKVLKKKKIWKIYCSSNYLVYFDYKYAWCWGYFQELF